MSVETSRNPDDRVVILNNNNYLNIVVLDTFKITTMKTYVYVSNVCDMWVIQLLKKLMSNEFNSFFKPVSVSIVVNVP